MLGGNVHVAKLRPPGHFRHLTLDSQEVNVQFPGNVAGDLLLVAQGYFHFLILDVWNDVEHLEQ